jgi:hypothetical protein
MSGIVHADVVDAPREQRHSITRIYHRLTDVHGMADVPYPVVRPLRPALTPQPLDVSAAGYRHPHGRQPSQPATTPPPTRSAATPASRCSAKLTSSTRPAAACAATTGNWNSRYPDCPTARPAPPERKMVDRWAVYRPPNDPPSARSRQPMRPMTLKTAPIGSVGGIHRHIDESAGSVPPGVDARVRP